MAAKRKRFDDNPNEFHRGLTRRFLANCINQDDRRGEFRIEMRPDYLTFTHVERRVFDAIMFYWEHGQPSTIDNLMASLMPYKDITNWQEQLEWILDERTEDGDVTSLSYQLWRYYEQNQIELVALENLELARNPGALTPSEIIDIQQRNLAKLTPEWVKVTDIRAGRSSQAILEAKQDKRYGRFLTGYDATPQMPYVSARKILYGLRGSDPLLITMPTKSGKSTLALSLAHRWAQQGYYVVFQQNETQIETFEQRWLASTLGMPTFMWRTGANLTDPRTGQKLRLPPISRKAPEWGKFFSRYDAVVKEMEQLGRLVYLNSPDPEITTIAAKIRVHKEKALALGLELIWIVDYLQATKLNKPAKDERERLSKIATGYKEISGATDAYTVVFSQQSINERTGEIQAFGSGEAQKRFQVHATVAREAPTSDRPVVNRDGKVMLNALGIPRYWHQNLHGQKDSAAQMIAMLGNDDPGGVANLRYENALFRVQDESEPIPVYEILLPD